MKLNQMEIDLCKKPINELFKIPLYVFAISSECPKNLTSKLRYEITHDTGTSCLEIDTKLSRKH
ncbi:CLUMA_CG013827, isoform A [Clunio marinus]|uniref:CLUMA_CG013827, isoform A n=1 Tax=Clunio marinus TaxID=568069 RepID=A0A1J1IK02_9DIPT|nr:CLUMA_CG013827, isoform A [Clunio marinus]